MTEHPTFKASIFKNNPSYLYGLSSVTIVNIDIPDSIVHFILEFPNIIENDIVELYSTDQLGLNTKDTAYCTYFKLPKFFFHLNANNYSINLNQCKSHRDLTVCPTFKHLLQPSCITLTNMTCSHQTTKCTSKFRFIYTGRGLFLRDNSQETYYTEKTGSIRKAHFDDRSIAMIDWQDINDIFIAQEYLLTNPNDNYNLNYDLNYNIQLTLLDKYPIDVINITEAFDEFYHTKGLTPFKFLTNTHSKRLIFYVIFAVSFLITISMSVIFIYIFHKRKHTPTITHHGNYIPLSQLHRHVGVENRRQSV